MKQVLDASAGLSNVSMWASQADAYRRTLRELRTVDAVDEAIQTISDWIISQRRSQALVGPQRGRDGLS